MSQHLAKDSAVWNRLMHGISWQPSVQPDKQSEKELISDEKCIHNEAPRVKDSKKGVVMKLLGFFAFMAFLLSQAGFNFGQLCLPKNYTGPVTLKNYGGFIDVNSFQIENAEPREIFEVSYPFVPKANYGKPVYSSVLIDHEFDSWGHPNLRNFSAPKDIKYNKVVLTLNTSVSGVQYDRLAHLYVGGAEIWRTSTVEPGNMSVFSTHRKDVSQYAQLFHEDTDVLFQLDNLVGSTLTGVFHVQLYADFYWSESFRSDPDHDVGNSTYLNETYKYFETRKAADKVYTLVESNDTEYPPIKHLPYQDFSVSLPKVSHNTTRLKLAVFASGNSHEEFWYNSVLDKYTHRFERDGTVFHGHGPLRFVNVWVDGKKVASQTPQPFIFTGGFSPALWNSVVPVDAFDMPSMDLDISGLLPLLWDSQPHELKILVDNGLDEVKGETSGIGNDWIISANLLAYENSEILLSSGEILKIDDQKKAHSFGISLPYTSSLQQVAGGEFGAEITSSFVYNLKNGVVLNNTMTSISKGDVSSVQLYSRLGKSAKIVHVGKSFKSFFLMDNTNDELIHQTDLLFKYPLTLIQSEDIVGEGTDLNVHLVHGKETTLKINDNTVMDESNFQNGTSTYHLRDTGNHGTGSLFTKFKSVVLRPTHKFVYKRFVAAEEGKITKDKASFKDHDKKHHD
ncbi:hypothetical protein METBIDRAFT_15328, partial [Metschnikowia bicuspidata var. bicuspidata NRRL YB-4993]